MPDDSGSIEPSEQPSGELEEREIRLGEDDQRILARLHGEFTKLQPGADIEIFEGRAQTALEQAKALTAQALIHYLAAEALARVGGEQLADRLNRALDHLERARSTLLALSTALYAKIGGPISMLRAGLRVNLERATSREDVAATVEACEEAVGLASADTNSEGMAALAYNAAFRLLRLDPSPAPDTPVFRRAEALFAKPSTAVWRQEWANAQPTLRSISQLFPSSASRQLRSERRKGAAHSMRLGGSPSGTPAGSASTMTVLALRPSRLMASSSSITPPDSDCRSGGKTSTITAASPISGKTKLRHSGSVV